MTDTALQQVEFLERCASLEGAAIGEGAFGPGPALWVGRRDVAHFDDDGTLDLRLTRALIRERREDLKQDDAIVLRPATSDWLQIRLDREHAERWLALVADAVAANLPTAAPGLPPTGAELARRRRFH